MAKSKAWRAKLRFDNKNGQKEQQESSDPFERDFGKIIRSAAKAGAAEVAQNVMTPLSHVLQEFERKERDFKELQEQVELNIKCINSITAQLNRVVQNAILDGVKRAVDKVMEPRVIPPQAQQQ